MTDQGPNGHDCPACGRWVYGDGDGDEKCSECKPFRCHACKAQLSQAFEVQCREVGAEGRTLRRIKWREGSEDLRLCQGCFDRALAAVCLKVDPAPKFFTGPC